MEEDRLYSRVVVNICYGFPACFPLLFKNQNGNSFLTACISRSFALSLATLLCLVPFRSAGSFLLQQAEREVRFDLGLLLASSFDA
jgi:hypothetical protein